MKVLDYIAKILPKKVSILFDQSGQGVFGNWYTESRDYSSLIWLNICAILNDLVEDVKVTLDPSQQKDKDKMYLFAAFRQFVYAWGRVVMQRLEDDGFVIIGYDGSRLWLMNSNEYTTPSDNNLTYVKPNKDGVQAYVMRDTAYILRGRSRLSLCRPWLDFLDDVCNGSATVSKRLGAVVIGSPKTYSGAPTPTVLTEEQKKKIESEIQENYGALRQQNQVMVLPKEMAFQVVNLAGLDLKFQEKVRECVLAIADAVQVPANQVALIDANSSKSLSNGTELREGDKAKYKAFHRLFERTFVMMAMDFGLKIAYQVDGEPIDAEVVAEGA